MATPVADPIATPLALISGFLTRWRATVVAALALAGLYFPTSHDAEISKELMALQLCLLAGLLCSLLFTPGGFLGTTPLCLVLAANLLLWLFTALSPLSTVASGAAAFYLVTSLLLCVRVRSIPATRLSRGVFLGTVWAALIAAALVAAHVEAVSEFFVRHYSAFWPGLVQHMLRLGKPVATFGTHSVAAFFFFLFFVATFEWYVARGGMVTLISALGCLVLLVLLRSSTAVFLSVAALLHVVIELCLNPSRRAMGFAMVLGVSASILLGSGLLDVPGLAEFELLGTRSRGLAARYSQQGLLAENLRHIESDPLRPVGFGYSPRLFYGDSGYVEMTLRGSPLLPALVYGAFAWFLFFNLSSRRLAFELLVVFLAFEIGFGNLIYLRTIGFLPLLLVILNGARGDAKPHPPR